MEMKDSEELRLLSDYYIGVNSQIGKLNAIIDVCHCEASHSDHKTEAKRDETALNQSWQQLWTRLTDRNRRIDETNSTPTADNHSEAITSTPIQSTPQCLVIPKIEHNIDVIDIDDTDEPLDDTHDESDSTPTAANHSEPESMARVSVQLLEILKREPIDVDVDDTNRADESMADNSDKQYLMDLSKECVVVLNRVVINANDCKQQLNSNDHDLSVENNSRNTQQKMSKSEEKAFVCVWPECGKKFKRSGDLKRHQLRHSEVKALECDYEGCDYKCNYKSNLKSHQLTHTKQKPFSCDWPQCGKKFAQSSSLNRHKLYHLKVKQFKCDYNRCDKRFTEKQSLTVHKNRHLKYKPYKCGFVDCGKSFVTTSDLKSHIRFIHTKEKPFQSVHQKCGKSFETASELARHSMIHSN